MLETIIVGVVALIGGFITGVLVGRANSKTVTTAINDVKSAVTSLESTVKATVTPAASVAKVATAPAAEVKTTTVAK